MDPMGLQLPPSQDTLGGWLFLFMFSLSLGDGLVALKGRIFQVVSWCWQNWRQHDSSKKYGLLGFPLFDDLFQWIDLFLLHHTLTCSIKRYHHPRSPRMIWWYLRFRVIFSWQKLHRTMKNCMLPQVCVFEKLRLQPFAEKSSPPRICFARIACGLPPCRPPSTCAQMEWEWLLWTAHQWTLKKQKASDQLGNDMGSSLEEHSCFVKYDVYTYVYI